ncbi:C40 family peptidase [Myceligenerans cantabricum]
MTTRTPGRHRAARTPITPLTPLTRAAARGISTTARRGAVVAAGSGLLVSLLGAPADATPAGDHDTSTAELEAVAQGLRQEGLEKAALQGATLPDLTLQAEAVPAQAAQEAATAPTVKVAADSTFAVETGTIKVTPAPEPEPEPEPEPVVAAPEPVEETAAPAVEEPAAQEEAVAEEPAAQEAPAPTTSSDILSIAKQYIGVPYLWGGSTPAGFDCSGFTSYVYAQVGISLPRTSSEQRYAGTVVSRAEAQPGDLIWSPGHIAIYAGGDMQVEAPVPGQTVRYTSIWQSSPTFIHVG